MILAVNKMRTQFTEAKSMPQVAAFLLFVQRDFNVKDYIPRFRGKCKPARLQRNVILE